MPFSPSTQDAEAGGLLEHRETLTNKDMGVVLRVTGIVFLGKKELGKADSGHSKNFSSKMVTAPKGWFYSQKLTGALSTH